MSRFGRRGWYPSTPKKPPPARGIKLGKIGTTWWGQRWIEALEEMSIGYGNRLARGRTYARAGRTHDLVVQAGLVTAKVTGSRASPYKVQIRLEKLPDAAWEKAIAAMSDKAQFTAELLAGRMPQEIDAAFKASGTSLFPAREADLVTDCSCPDWANPCKHVAATHYVLGEALDRDPFLLFELRGRTKDQVLQALRAARASAGKDTEKGERTPRKASRRSAPQADEVPAVALGKIKPADYDKLQGPLPALNLGFTAPEVSASVLRQLGAPPGWTSDQSPSELLGPAIRAAADTARRLALAEPEPSPGSDPREQAPEASARPKDEKARTGRKRASPARPAARKARARAAKNARAKGRQRDVSR